MSELVCPFNSFKPCSYDCAAYLGSRGTPIQKNKCALLTQDDNLHEIAIELNNISYSLDHFTALDISVTGGIDVSNYDMG